MRSSQFEEKIIRVMNAVAAGTTDQTSSAVDMQLDGGWDSCEFVAAVGALSANQVTELKAQQSSDDAVADDYTDLAGSKTTALVTATDANKLIRLEVVSPEKRYLKAVLLRETGNAVIDGIFAILRRGRKLPITQNSTVAQAKVVVKPLEGTA